MYQPGPRIQSTGTALDADNVHPTVMAGRLWHNPVLEKGSNDKTIHGVLRSRWLSTLLKFSGKAPKFIGQSVRTTCCCHMASARSRRARRSGARIAKRRCSCLFTRLSRAMRALQRVVPVTETLEPECSIADVLNSFERTLSGVTTFNRNRGRPHKNYEKLSKTVRNQH
jgi:hypothetical protein